MVVNSVHHTYKHIQCRQSSECSLSKKQSSDPLLDHTQEGFIFMEPISFQGSLLYFRQNLLVLLFASPSHLCFLHALSPSCHRYFGTFSQSHLPRPRLLDFFLLELLLCVTVALSREIQTQDQIADWLDLCQIRQPVLEISLLGVPGNSAAVPCLLTAVMRSPSELAAKQEPDGICEGCSARLGG